MKSMFPLIRDISRYTVILFITFFASLSHGPVTAQTDVIMQGFYWNTNPGDTASNTGVWWDSIGSVAQELSDAGFKTVWTPPATKGFAGILDMGYGTYDYFDFGEFDQKGTIRTRHGSREQLKAMIDSLHNAGLLVMADVVLNHRAGAENQQPEDCDDGDGQQLRFTDFDPASGRSPMNNWDFHPNFVHCDLNGPEHNRLFFEDLCYFNFLNQVLDSLAPDSGWYFGPHHLGKAGDSLIVWGRYLTDTLGFDEIRLDAVKHIEPGFIAPFLVELNNGDQPFAVGELFDGNLGTLQSYHDRVDTFVTTLGIGSKDANLAIFDFNLRFALRDMANTTNGSYDMWNLNTSGLALNPVANIPGEDIVTFVENHDFDRLGWVIVSCNQSHDLQIGSTCLEIQEDSGHDPVFSDKYMAYAYIMAAEGKPSVFWKDWYWYHLDNEIRWQMALRKATAVGAALPIQDLSAFFVSGDGGDLFVLNRNGNGQNQNGLVLAMNDNSSTEFAAYVNTPFSNIEMKDYSDAFIFFQTQVFSDTRAFVKASPRNYAWYAPTGLYPQPPGNQPSIFALGNHAGAKLKFLVFKAMDSSQLIVNGLPIQPGDEIAVLPAASDTAVGLGRIGQRFQWDGEHDMIVEILGGTDTAQAKGGLLFGESYRIAVWDESEAEMIIAIDLIYFPSDSGFQFSADRPASRGGNDPFDVTATLDSNIYQVGAIARISALDATIPDVIYVDSAASGKQNGFSWTDAFTNMREAVAFAEEYDKVDSILVARGTYLPGLSMDRQKRFEIRDSLVLLGGFANGGSALNARDPILNLTRLSGDIGIQGNNSDNVYHVISIDSSVNSAVIDGFVVEGGNANGPGQENRGAAVLSQGDIQFNQMVFRSNAGVDAGAILYHSGNGAIMTLLDCQFTENTSDTIQVLNANGAQILMDGNTLIGNE